MLSFVCSNHQQTTLDVVRVELIGHDVHTLTVVVAVGVLKLRRVVGELVCAIKHNKLTVPNQAAKRSSFSRRSHLTLNSRHDIRCRSTCRGLSISGRQAELADSIFAKNVAVRSSRVSSWCRCGLCGSSDRGFLLRRILSTDVIESRCRISSVPFHTLTCNELNSIRLRKSLRFFDSLGSCLALT